MDLAGGTPLLDSATPFLHAGSQVFGILPNLLVIRGQRSHAPGHIGQRLQSRLNADHGGAIELHLFAHVPVQRTRDQTLEALDDRVPEPRGARIYCSDCGNLRFRGIAGMHQRHQVGRGRAIGTQRALGNARAGFRLHFLNRRGQLFVSHLIFVRAYCAVMRVEIPPRGVKSPTTVAEMGLVHFTTSASMRLTAFS